jgi:hypothetical protein
MGKLPPRSLLEMGIMLMPSRSSSTQMNLSASLSARTTTRSPSPSTFSSPLTISVKKQLSLCHHGSSTYSGDPLLPTTPSAKLPITSMTGLSPPKSSNTTAMTTATNASLPSLRKSKLSLDLSRIHSLLHAAAWKWCDSLPTLQIWKDEPFPKPNLANDEPIPCKGSLTMMRGDLTRLDMGIQSRMEGD